jgi:hypothetical protein
MSLILDHINGVATDNRLENLRVVCPNCAATFETHCGRANRRPARIARCPDCNTEFIPKDSRPALLLANVRPAATRAAAQQGPVPAVAQSRAATL